MLVNTAKSHKVVFDTNNNHFTGTMYATFAISKDPCLVLLDFLFCYGMSLDSCVTNDILCNAGVTFFWHKIKHKMSMIY